MEEHCISTTAASTDSSNFGCSSGSSQEAHLVNRSRETTSIEPCCAATTTESFSRRLTRNHVDWKPFLVLAMIVLLDRVLVASSLTSPLRVSRRVSMVGMANDDSGMEEKEATSLDLASPPSSKLSHKPVPLVRSPRSRLPLVTSRQPHQLGDGRSTFLGFRNVKDLRGTPTAQHSSSGVGALMPDGGLSPCVIRVLGVGGGGCNAVRCVQV
jgi:hypothetical protein